MDFGDEPCDEFDSDDEPSDIENTEFTVENDALNCVQSDSEDEETPFQVLSTDQIVQHMVDSIKEVNTVLRMPPTTTRVLLNHFKWDQQKLLERFYDGDQEKLFEEARVVNPHGDSIIEPISSCSLQCQSSSEIKDCEICYIAFQTHMMSGLVCGHRFCTDCWDEYLTMKIKGEGVSQTIVCPAHDCKILVDDTTIMKLVKNPKVKLRYQQLITDSFVECHRLLRWCPAADCTCAIKVEYRESQSVTCKCGYTFCFHCGHNCHEPVKCDILKKWLKKYDEDIASCKWISKNTKDCPKCNYSIEKSGGCNHVICANKNCNHQFCWVCLGLWETHQTGAYSCNRYVGEIDKKKTRMSLKRYFFYCNRYKNHMQSLKFERELYASVQKKMEEMQQNSMSWIEVQFLKKAVDVLCLCRKTLMNTYIFPYFLRRNNQIEIFEKNQEDLEKATECLSEYLERKITDENLSDLKQKVEDKYRYCSSRRKALLKHVNEGYDKDWWEYLS